MKKWLVAVALVLGVLLIAGVLVVNSLDLGDILGGDCFCGDGDASWSPDGTLIVYAHNDREGDTHLYTISPDGGKPKRVTDDGNDESPVWSPDGTKLAFVQSETDQPDSLDVSPSYVQVMNADGGDTRILGNETGVGLLRWSPNGRSVAYLGEDDALASTGHPAAAGSSTATVVRSTSQPPTEGCAGRTSRAEPSGSWTGLPTAATLPSRPRRGSTRWT